MRATTNVLRDAHADAARAALGMLRARFVSNALAFGLFVVAFYVAYRYAMSFSQATASPFWFPISVLLSALLVARPRWWPVLVASTLPIRLFSEVSAGLPVTFLVETFAIDSVGVVLTAATLRRYLDHPLRLDTVRDYGLYALVAVVLVPAVAAFGGAAARQTLGHDYWTAWREWFLGDALTHLIVTPTICYWILSAPWRSVLRARHRHLEAALLTVGLVASAFSAFFADAGSADIASWRLYLPAPFVLWAAIRFGMLGATGAITCLVLAAVTAALHGYGPFAGQSPQNAALALQHFLFERAAPLFLVCILLEQKRRVENSLRESERLFHTTADTVPAMIWLMGPNKLCDFVNQRWLEFSGRTFEQEIGTGWTDGIHPDDRAPCIEILERAWAERGKFEHEYRMLSADGGYRWILDVGLPRYSPSGEFAGYVGCASDITERRAQVVALRASEERYREVVDAQTDLVCRYLPDTTLTFVNEAYCRFFGKTREELIGTSLLDLLPKETHDAARRYMAQVVAEPADNHAIEHQVRLPNGGVGWQHWVDHAVLGPDGRVEEFQGIGRDITDRKRAEEANRNLAHASRLVAVGTLTAMIAHEVNQPLCAIRCNAEAGLALLKSARPPLDEIREILTDICRDDQRADEIVSRVRALSRKRDFQPQTLDLNAVIADVMRLANGDAARRQVRVVTELEPGLPPVRGDVIQVQQVLLNLLVNSLDAMRDTPPPGRHVTVRTKARTDQRVEVAVADRGHGIPADELPRVFDSFFTTKVGGMGMGLSIARSIMETHEGRIWAENNADGGATFRFVLRVAE
ncbi:MAG TPA: PAS domain S-box protein [Gammaproteobacteria bacterium]|nr:PAS domain S-box protein [Gammaproteobacteria bacterium]